MKRQYPDQVGFSRVDNWFQRDLARYGPGTQPFAGGLVQARAYCQNLAQNHYENFSVLTFWVRGAARHHMRAVYAFSRWADNLADEVADPAESRRLLAWWREQISQLNRPESRPSHPVFVALKATALELGLPLEPFHHLIDAFERDKEVLDHPSLEELLDYCKGSANPVGRLVLRIFGAANPRRDQWSDAICSALQLANFWQDIGRDRKIGRIYLPADLRRQFGVTEADLDQTRASENLKALVLHLCRYTRDLFHQGAPLLRDLEGPLAPQVKLFHDGGIAILDAIEKQGGDTLSSRPTVGKVGKLKLMGKTLLALSGWSRLWPGNATNSPRENPAVSLGASHAWCRNVAKTKAGNFYPAFGLLPTGQHRAMCALYAFLRVTDDIADEPEPGQDPLASLEAWKLALKRALVGEPSHPLHPALAWSVRTFGIDPAHLEEAIAGVAMDLHPLRFETIREAEGYCHKVASVVGLCCLAIWGCRNRRAYPAAIATGYALQWTNILRDLREDAGRGRLYLPLEDLRRFGVTEDEISRGEKTQKFRQLMEFEIRRARDYYRQAWRLRRHLPPAGAAMFTALVGIYQGLLEHLALLPDRVLDERVSLSKKTKALIALSAWPWRLNQVPKPGRISPGSGLGGRTLRGMMGSSVGLAEPGALGARKSQPSLSGMPRGGTGTGTFPAGG